MGSCPCLCMRVYACEREDVQSFGILIEVLIPRRRRRRRFLSPSVSHAAFHVAIHLRGERSPTTLFPFPSSFCSRDSRCRLDSLPCYSLALIALLSSYTLPPFPVIVYCVSLCQSAAGTVRLNEGWEGTMLPLCCCCCCLTSNIFPFLSLCPNVRQVYCFSSGVLSVELAHTREEQRALSHSRLSAISRTRGRE